MVPEQSSGLRFDIYERVQLPEHAAGIKELEEIELSPNIHVQQQAEQTVLKGNLRLSGRYAGDTEQGGSQVLEYLIPVEITLPTQRSRIQDELGAEIENFDIDVVDARSLNVTGVLSLKGLDVSLPDHREWQEEEEVIFIHEAREELVKPAKPVEPVKPAKLVETVKNVEFAKPIAPVESLKPAEPAKSAKLAVAAEINETVKPAGPLKPAEIAPPAEPVGKERINALNAEAAKVEQIQFQTSSSEPQPVAEHKVMPGKEANVPVDTENAKIQNLEAAENSVSNESIESDEKQEMKIAFGSKKIFETIQEKAYHLKNLLHRQADFDEQSVESKAAADADLDDTKATDDRLEWKSLFLPKEDGEQFRKMRMCIVQKQESLETIAERYSLNPREIILFNRLTDNEVSEGQVIYIPK